MFVIEKSCWYCKHCHERFEPGNEPSSDYSQCLHPDHEDEHSDRGERIAEDCPDYKFDESLKNTEIQAEINARCPCMSKPLNECDCECDEEDTTGLVGCTTCPLCGSWDYEIDEMGNCSICGNTVDNL